MMTDESFQMFASVASIIVGLCSLAYGFLVFSLWTKEEMPTLTSFLVQPNPRKLGSALMTVGGLAASVAVVGIHRRLGDGDSLWAIWSLGVGIAFSLITAVHGMFLILLESVLSNLYNRGDKALQSACIAIDYLPSPLDPFGFSRYILSGIWLLVNGLQIIGSSNIPPILGFLAVASSLGLLTIFIGNVIGKTKVMRVIGTAGAVVVGPIFWIWTGWVLMS